MSWDSQQFNPFPGLRHFEFDETALFFGRDGQSDEVLRRLRMQRFLAVIGTSGSGKSSLIRAGVLPAIYGGMMVQAGSRWRHAIFRPGDDPIGNLSRALGEKGVLAPEHAQDDALDTVLIESTLRSSGLGLIDVARLAHLPPRENVLVIVDQFEELFRFAGAAQGMRREDDAAAFVKLLLEATRQDTVPIYVIITMRSDFIGDCARFRDLAEAVNDGMFLIPRMTRDQRKEAICGPVAVGGAEIAPRLVNRLLNDAGDNPDQLPIMQHALMRTWNYWEKDHQPGEPLDLRHYEAIGGMAEALSRHAEEAYAELPDDRHREIAKRLFQSLTEKGGDNREVRRPTRILEIMERTHADLSQVLATVECFRQPHRSFLMPPPDVPLNEQSIVDISHESLIRGWQRLKDWVQEESTSAETYRRLAETAAYNAQGRAGFLTNPELSVALAWRQREQPSSAWATRYRGDFDLAMRFLEDSAVAFEAEELAKERRRLRELRRLQAFSVVVLFAFLVAAVLGAISLRERSKVEKASAASRAAEGHAVQALGVAQRQKAEADRQRTVAEEEKKEADRQQKTAETEKQEAEAEKKEAELSAALLHDEVLASRRKVVSDQNVITYLSDLLGARSSRISGIVALQEQGEAYSETGDHQAAIQQLDKVLEIQPDNLSALMGRGYEYLLLDEPEKSIVDTRKFLAMAPRQSSALENLALAEAMMREYAAAKRDTWDAIATYSPTENDENIETELSPDVQKATGHQLMEATGPTYVVALYYEIAAIDAMSGDPHFVADLKKADEVAARYPISPEPYQLILDWAWLETRHFPDYGISAFFGAMWEKLAVSDPRFHRWAYDQYTNFEKDDAEFHDPRYRELAKWVRHRLSGMQVPGHEASSDDFNTLREEAEELQIRIGNSSDLMQLALLRSKLDQLIARANSPAQHDTLVDLLRHRAVVEDEAKDLPALHTDCEEILKLDPHNATAEYYLAIHEPDDALKRKEFEAALADDPIDVDVLSDYSSYLISKGDRESLLEALKLTQTLIRLRPYWTTVQYKLANVEHLLHEDDRALISANNLVAIAPEASRYYETRRDIEASMAGRRQSADLHLAAGYLTAANILAHLDRQDEALAEYIQAFNAAASLPNQQDPDVKFQVEITAQRITQFLATHSSPEEVSQFWRATAASTKNPVVTQWANKEIAQSTPR